MDKGLLPLGLLVGLLLPALLSRRKLLLPTRSREPGGGGLGWVGWVWVGWLSKTCTYLDAEGVGAVAAAWAWLRVSFLPCLDGSGTRHARSVCVPVGWVGAVGVDNINMCFWASRGTNERMRNGPESVGVGRTSGGHGRGGVRWRGAGGDPERACYGGMGCGSVGWAGLGAGGTRTRRRRRAPSPGRWRGRLGSGGWGEGLEGGGFPLPPGW